MLQSMDEEFSDIVGISVLLRIYGMCCIFLSFHSTNLYFWLSFVLAILVLIIGTKLQRVVVKLAVETLDGCPFVKPQQFNLRSELFWFGKPRFVLHLIHLISFLNAFEMVSFLWSLSNPENTVGVLTMKGVRVLVTPTSDLGKILACMHEISGEMNLAGAIQVAQLALKHRQNKMQQQRIIVFAGSPIKQEKKLLEMIGRKLKKNSVALDIIVNFGEEDEGKTEKLEALLAAVNNNGTNHIFHVPSGPNALSDVFISTPIFTGDGEGGSGFAAAAAASDVYEFDVNPNVDPELYRAQQISMEEERARQEAAAKRAAEDAAKQEKGVEQPASSQDAMITERAGAATSEAENKTTDLMDDDNALLQLAIAMSMDDPSISHDVKDMDMSDAAADDPELNLA